MRLGGLLQWEAQKLISMGGQEVSSKGVVPRGHFGLEGGVLLQLVRIGSSRSEAPREGLHVGLGASGWGRSVVPRLTCLIPGGANWRRCAAIASGARGRPALLPRGLQVWCVRFLAPGPPVVLRGGPVLTTRFATALATQPGGEQNDDLGPDPPRWPSSHQIVQVRPNLAQLRPSYGFVDMKKPLLRRQTSVEIAQFDVGTLNIEVQAAVGGHCVGSRAQTPDMLMEKTRVFRSSVAQGGSLSPPWAKPP